MNKEFNVLVYGIDEIPGKVFLKRKPATVKELLQKLSMEKKVDLFKKYNNNEFSIYKNGLRIKGLETSLKENDKIIIVSSLIGG